MKDTGSIVSVYTALLSSLTYGGVSVPVYEDDPVETVPDNYVQIIQVSDSPTERNNSRWVREVTVQLDVITRQYKVSNRTVRDSIANSILEALITSVGVNLINADFQITNIELDNSTYLNELDGAYHINRKILSIRNHLIQI
jgi:hypothetical protein